MWKELKSFLSELPFYAQDMVLAGAAILLGLLINIVLLYIARIYCRRHKGFSLLRSVLQHLIRPLNWLVPLLLLNLALPIMHFQGSALSLVKRANGIFLIISFAALLIGIVKVVQDFVFHVYDLHKDNNLRERKIRTQLQFVRKFLVYVIIILAGCAILLSFDGLRRIGASLLTGVGIGGIIIGLAAQKSIGNFLAGLQIAFTQPIRIDDVVVVEGEWGRVEEISLTYVVINIWDKRRLVLPITYFIEKPFQNWTRTSAEILGTVFLYLDYSAPVETIRKKFHDLIKDNENWDGKVGVVQVTDINDRTMQVRCLVSASTSGKAFDLRCMLREKLVDFIQREHAYCLPKTRAILDGVENNEGRLNRNDNLLAQEVSFS